MLKLNVIKIEKQLFYPILGVISFQLRRYQEARFSLKESEVNAIQLMHPSEVLISLGRFRCGFITVNECST